MRTSHKGGVSRNETQNTKAVSDYPHRHNYFMRGGCKADPVTEEEWIWPDAPKTQQEETPSAEDETEGAEMAKIETYFDCDLKKAVQVQPLNGNVFSLDNNGNRIGVRIFDNGVKTTVTGTVTGRAILADNSTVNLNGGLTTVNGQSVAYVDVPQGALLIPGTIKISIQLTASGVITTLAAILSTVYQTKTDNVITPSAQVIADWNATISSAIQAQDAAIAAETAARIAADSDLKSALYFSAISMIDVCPNHNMILVGGRYVETSESWRTSNAIAVKSGDVFFVSRSSNSTTSLAKLAFYEDATTQTATSQVLMTGTDETFTCPSDGFIRLCRYAADTNAYVYKQNSMPGYSKKNIDDIAALATRVGTVETKEQKYGSEGIGTGTTTSGTEFTMTNIPCNVKTGDKFYVLIEYSNITAVKVMQLQADNAWYASVENRDTGKWIEYTASKNISNLRLYTGSGQVVGATNVTFRFVVGDLYNTKKDTEIISKKYDEDIGLFKSNICHLDISWNIDQGVTIMSGLNFKNGDTIKVFVKVTGTLPSNGQLRTGTTYITSLEGKFNKWFDVTLSTDVTQLNLLFGTSYVSGACNVQLIVATAISKDVINYNGRIDILEMADLGQRKSAVTHVETGVNTNINIDTITGISFASGETIKVMIKTTGSTPTVCQLRKGSTYLASISLFNKWVTVTLSTNVDSLSVYIGDSYITGAVDVQLIVSSGLTKEVYDNTERLDHIEDASSFLPPYYTKAWMDNLQEKMETFNDSIVNGIAFGFVTDLHFRDNRGRSKYLMRYFMDKGCFPIAISGGDYPYAFGTQENVEWAIAQLDEYRNVVGKEFYQVRGNHDFTIKKSAEEDTGYTAPFPISYNHITRPTEWEAVDASPDHMCYVIENKAQRTRIIALNTCDGQSDSTSTPWGVTYVVTRAQLDWLLNSALNIEGYRIIFVGHIPIDANLLGYSASNEELFKIAKAIKNKESYSYDGLSKDFTNTTNEFVMSLSGHTHQDLSAKTNNVLSVITTCDALYTDDGHGRTGGTTSENAFDVFFIDFDQKTVDAVRVGGGVDRDWTY